MVDIFISCISTTVEEVVLIHRPYFWTWFVDPWCIHNSQALYVHILLLGELVRELPAEFNSAQIKHREYHCIHRLKRWYPEHLGIPDLSISTHKLKSRVD
jgi:hypothetical protein